jgi:peptidoglycan/xylan/chitin deacetylase (PgdA/CDA1 family)/sulfur carrier protein ThiS
VTRAAAALAATLVLLGTGCGQRSRVTVVIDGTAEHVATGSTLARATQRLGLHPRAGNLLDVEGDVLRRGVFPGRLRVNGRHVPSSTSLHDGDRIELVAGRNRVERREREIRSVPGGIPANPQSRVERTAGVEVVVRGAISRKLVSSRFRTVDGPTTVERAVALTFDDGPSPTDTPRVLEVLHRMHARATFFVIGFLVDAYPEIVTREHEAGMAIGNHTYNHPEVPPFNQLPRRLLEDEIALGAQSLSKIGIASGLLRPPAGSSSPNVVRAAEASGERVVLWSVDPVDWPAGVKVKQIKRNVLSAVQPGSIVLLHDGGGDQSATVAALPGIIKGIRRKHLRLVTLAP